MCPCLIEDIKQEAEVIIAFIQSLYLGKVHYVIYFQFDLMEALL